MGYGYGWSMQMGGRDQRNLEAVILQLHIKTCMVQGGEKDGEVCDFGEGSTYNQACVSSCKVLLTMRDSHPMKDCSAFLDIYETKNWAHKSAPKNIFNYLKTCSTALFPKIRVLLTSALHLEGLWGAEGQQLRSTLAVILVGELWLVALSCSDSLRPLLWTVARARQVPIACQFVVDSM